MKIAVITGASSGLGIEFYAPLSPFARRSTPIGSSLAAKTAWKH